MGKLSANEVNVYLFIIIDYVIVPLHMYEWSIIKYTGCWFAGILQVCNSQ